MWYSVAMNFRFHHPNILPQFTTFNVKNRLLILKVYWKQVVNQRSVLSLRKGFTLPRVITLIMIWLYLRAVVFQQPADAHAWLPLHVQPSLCRLSILGYGVKSKQMNKLLV